MNGAVTLTDEAIDALARELCRWGREAGGRRPIVGIAGVPGAGKSTFAERLLARTAGEAALVPMDGFHWPNDRLREWGLLERKGAPETFDAHGYIATLERFADASQRGPFPIYDRARHEPVVPAESPHLVTDRTRVVLTEGNYLLLDEPPWRALARLLDETWWLATPLPRARRWMMQRHRAVGRTQAEAERRWVYDARNAARVVDHQRTPDRVLAWPGEGDEA